jgi:hypothetical protein
VRAGEFLTYIAQCYDVSWQQLYWENRKSIGSRQDLLHPGQDLVIPPHDLKVPNFVFKPTFKPGVDINLPCPANSPSAKSGSCPTQR